MRQPLKLRDQAARGFLAIEQHRHARALLMNVCQGAVQRQRNPGGTGRHQLQRNPNWNFVGALKQALHSDVVSYAEDGHGPILPMLSYLKSDDFKNSPPQVLIWEFPERYLPVNNEIGDADPAWVAQLKQAGSRQQNMAINTSKSETPDRAQN